MRRRLRRPLLAAAVAFATGAAGSISFTATSANADTSTTTSSALIAPTFPAPSVPTIDMTCDAGQTDLNTATSDQLATAMNLPADERYIADNIVSLRGSAGYNGLPDLLQNGTGVGPGMLSHLDPSKFCVTPVGGIDTFTAAIPDTVCPLAGSKVDFNTASADAIDAVLPGSPRKTRPTAERIAARASELPFPSLEAVTAVPGFGPGMLDKVRADMCLTPAQVDVTGANGLPQTAALVIADTPIQISLATSQGSFSLGIPAGTLTTDHAWATITQLVPHRDLGVAVADLHIDDNWSDGTKKVWATVPADPFQPPGFVQSLVHMPTDGTPNQFFTGDALATSSDGSELTAPLTTLSPTQGESIPGLTPDVSFLFKNDPNHLYNTPLQPTGPDKSYTPADVATFIMQVLGYRSHRPSCPSDSGISYTYAADITGFYTDNGEIPTCHWVNGNDGKLRVKAVNNKAFIAEMQVYPSMATGSGANLDRSLDDAPNTFVGAAMQDLLNALTSNLGLHYLAPGGQTGFDLNPASSTLQPGYHPDFEATVAYVGINYLIGRLVDAFPSLAETQTIVQCLYPLSVNHLDRASDQLGEIWGCLQPYVSPMLKSYGKAAGAEIISRALMYADIGAPLMDYVDYKVQDIIAKFTGNVPIKIAYAVNSSPGPIPITDRYGRTIVDSCLAGGQFDTHKGFVPYSYDEACQDTYYGGTPGGIGGGNTTGSDGNGGTFSIVDASQSSDGTIVATPNKMDSVLIVGASGVPNGVITNDSQFQQIGNRSYLDCLSLTQGLPIRWNMSQAGLDAWASNSAPYPGYGGANCNTPAASWISQDLTNYILRNPDNGQSWFLDASSTIHDIQSGGVFLCLANKYLVRQTTDPTGHYVSGGPQLGSFVSYPHGAPASCP